MLVETEHLESILPESAIAASEFSKKSIIIKKLYAMRREEGRNFKTSLPTYPKQETAKVGTADPTNTTPDILARRAAFTRASAISGPTSL
jgi:hypothetical protein